MNGVNLFDLMYKDPKRYGFVFQSYVQLTMLEMHDEILQSQIEQVKRFEAQSEQLKKQLEPAKQTSKQVSIFQDLTNKDQKESNDKKRKSSQDEISSLKKAKTEASDKLADQPLAETDESKGQTVDYSINMMERSIFSARYIFVENLYQK